MLFLERFDVSERRDEIGIAADAAGDEGLCGADQNVAAIVGFPRAALDGLFAGEDVMGVLRVN